MAKVLNHTSHKEIGKERRNIVIACEELDYSWCSDELKLMASMWNEGRNLKEMANHFNRDPDEVMIACIHLARKGRISNRNVIMNGQRR